MPIICRNRETGEIAAAYLRNKYDLMYYGAVWWEDIETAELSKQQSLQEAGLTSPESWELLEVNENRLKLLNVKWNNQASTRIIMKEDGEIHVLR